MTKLHKLLCTLHLHKWELIEGTEKYTDKYYNENGFFYCTRCWLADNKRSDIA